MCGACKDKILLFPDGEKGFSEVFKRPEWVDCEENGFLPPSEGR